jgi:purine-nucleoside phosphorylase
MTTVFFAATAVLTVSQFHAYEGHSLDTVVYPIRLMAALGVKDVISVSHPFADFPLSSVLTDEVVVTNAAGSLKAEVPVGTSTFHLKYPSIPITSAHPLTPPPPLTPTHLSLLATTFSSIPLQSLSLTTTSHSRS